MAKTWLSVTVELLGGGGQDLWPWPGRIFAVGPSHTFAQFAEAIDDAFARWDRAHLSQFTLADGRDVDDPEPVEDPVLPLGSPLLETVDITTARVARTVQRGEEFQYVFDLGDNWTHRCVVAETKVDPLDVLGIRPSVPMPYWGWGSIPDQYGRRWNGDDGEHPMPPRPASPHPMQLHAWPGQKPRQDIDLGALRRATAAGDADAVLETVVGVEIDEVLQQVGAAVAPVLAQRRKRAEPVVASIYARLSERNGPGDPELAEDLLALLRGKAPAGRVVPVDLDAVADALDVDPSMTLGSYLDLVSGETFPAEITDPAEVGEDAAVDVDADPDRWLWIEPQDSRDGWRDMAVFADAQRDAGLRERLQRAIDGRGAFRRFRETVAEEGLGQRWHGFHDDRRWGRARELLAAEGIRVGTPPRDDGPGAPTS